MRVGRTGSYAKSRAIPTATLALTESHFAAGSLRVASYARPGKLFTAHRDLMIAAVGHLNPEALKRVTEAVVSLLQASLPA